MSASLIGHLGQALSDYPPLQCRCRSRARASLGFDDEAAALLSASAPIDLAGTYTGVGGGAAVAAGVSGVRLRNEKGVVLEGRQARGTRDRIQDRKDPRPQGPPTPCSVAPIR
jgi:hypothetical protein